MSAETKLNYPSVKRDPEITKFKHGAQGRAYVVVQIDYYQWLEKTKSEDVIRFENDQNNLTTDFINACPELEGLRTVMTSMSKETKISCPTESEAGSLFYFMANGDQEFDSIYVQDGIKGKRNLFLSPHCLTSRMQDTVLRMYNLSCNGEILAYAYGERDSRWYNIKFRATKTLTDFPEILKNVCDSDISWTKDNQGILYSCYLNPTSNKSAPSDHKIVFHRIGTNQADDVILIEFPGDPLMTMQAQVSDCGEIVFVYAQENQSGHNHHLYYGDMKGTIEKNYEVNLTLYHLLEGIGLDTQYITTKDDYVYFRTNRRAPNFRIVRVNLLNPTLTKGMWETIVSEDPKRLLDWAVCVNRTYLMICYVEDATHLLELHSLADGNLLHKYSLPKGTITDYSGGRDRSRFIFSFSSFLIPDEVHYINVSSNSKIYNCVPILRNLKKRYRKIYNFGEDLRKKFRMSEFCVKQRFCVSQNDGTTIPIFLIHNKHLALDGQSPCIIYAQGCFGVQMMPCFSIPKLLFLRSFQGIIAIVGVRGGGEYGEKWYRDGNGLRKQQSYDDLISATEFLIKLRYTSPSRLILEGEYFGGNLAAACVLQRPDLYGAVLIHDGLLDLMRYHLFPESEPYIAEFGNPDMVAHYDALNNISPLHNVSNENTAIHTIPPVLILVGGEPSFAHCSNSYKFISELQHMFGMRTTNPLLLRTRAHTRFQNPTIHAKIEERAEIFGFLIRTLGLQFRIDPKEAHCSRFVSTFLNDRFKEFKICKK